MPFRQAITKVFDKGIIDRINEEEIPRGAASDSLNFISLGDKIELIRGREAFGNKLEGAGEVVSIETATGVDGVEHTYRRRGTVLEWYNSSTETWDIVLSGLTDGEDMSMTPYRTPAGSFMIFSSPTTGLYRANLQAPTDVVDFYDAAKNFKGYTTVEDNRMWLWGDIGNSAADVGNEGILRLSYIDNDWPYTDISGEAWDTADGSGTYSNALAEDYIVGRSLSIVHSQETWTDNGDGTLTGDDGGTGTVNYTTGAVSVTFGSADPGSGAITASYSYEQPKSEGIFDFTYSSPNRTAGQGAFFFQASEGDEIKVVVTFEGVQYAFHDDSEWTTDLTNDDTNATNKLYRSGTGVSTRKNPVKTGDGIYYIDTARAEGVTIRLLQYNDFSSRVLPVSKSDQLNLDTFVFDECAGIEFGDYIIWACKSSADVSYNDTMLLDNKRWGLLDKADGLYSDFTVRGGKLYGASSVTNNVYQLFTDYQDGESGYDAYWISSDDMLDTEQLKKHKRFVVEGDIEESQTIYVDISYDNGAWVELGSIAGDSQYVDSTATTEYGKVLYGGGTYGSGEAVTAARYMREFRVRSDKFYRARVRFRTQDIGYVNVRQFMYRDIRKSLVRVPSKYR